MLHAKYFLTLAEFIVAQARFSLGIIQDCKMIILFLLKLETGSEVAKENYWIMIVTFVTKFQSNFIMSNVNYLYSYLKKKFINCNPYHVFQVPPICYLVLSIVSTYMIVLIPYYWRLFNFCNTLLISILL